ncbi:MAG TPA: acylphosphatase [Gemmatimonadaceae bacterium]|nr:acylphosphatase [Gemmatimonadaceae bacterium]
MFYVAVRGRVQGVGFRWFVRERARALGLTGWVRNTQDGAVEVLAVGNDDALQRLRGLLGSGPSGARVSAVEDQQLQPNIAALDPFGILR